MEIVDLPIKNGDVPYQTVSLPELSSPSLHPAMPCQVSISQDARTHVAVEIQGIFWATVNHGADLHMSLSIHVGLNCGVRDDGTKMFWLENLGILCCSGHLLAMKNNHLQ